MSLSLENDQCYFRWTVQPHRRIDYTEAAAGVYLQLPDTVQPGVVFLSQSGQNNWADAGDPHLAAVRMSGQLEVDWKARRVIRKIGLVREQYGRFRGWNSCQCFRQIGLLLIDVIDPADPQPVAPTLNRKRFISQDANPAIGERPGNDLRTVPVVVIPEYRDHRDSFPTCEHIGTRLRITRTRGAVSPVEGMRNKIPSENKQVGTQRLRDSHRPLHSLPAHIRTEVDVGYLRDPKSVEPLRQAGKANLDVLSYGMVRFPQKPVDSGHACQCSSPINDELAA